MPKFSFEKIVKAEQGKVFSTFTDFKKLQEIAPGFFDSIRIRSSRDDVSVIEENLKLDSKIFVMMTKHVVNYPNFHKIYGIGGDSKGTIIEETFTQDGDKTRVSVLIDFKLSGKQKLVHLFKSGQIEQNFAKMYDKLVKYSES